MRTCPGRIEPEIFFRIIHGAIQGQQRDPTAAYCEQTVEIILGPKGAFEKGNIGALTRQVATARVVSAVPPGRGMPKPPKEPRTPRAVELLRKAIEWQNVLESGQVVSQADIARREGITRARVRQIMGMLRLAPEILEHVLSMPDAASRLLISERMLRCSLGCPRSGDRFLFHQQDGAGHPTDDGVVDVPA